MEMTTLYLNAKAPMTIGKIVTLYPGSNELEKATIDALNKTRIAKYLYDNEILASRERDPDRVYTPANVDPEDLMATSGQKSAKPLGKDGKSAMTPDGKVDVGGLPDGK